MRKLPRLTVTRVAVVLAGLLVGYLIFLAVGDTLLSHRLTEDEGRVREEIGALQEQQRDLIAIREYLRTDEYVERIARELLGWVRPGEVLITVSSDIEPTPSAEDEADPGRSWWEKLYSP